MELAEIRPFEPQMAEIDLFTMPDAVGVGEPSVRKVKPYISGHVTDGSSTFTFTVNDNETVTVPVDANGNWKWVVDRTITSLENAFKDITTLDECYLYKVNTSGRCVGMFSGCSNLAKLTLDCSLDKASNLYDFTKNTSRKILVCKSIAFNDTTSGRNAFPSCDSIIGLENSTFENVQSAVSMFYDYRGETLDLPNADFKAMTSSSLMFANLNTNVSNLKNINIKGIYISINFASHPKLTEQSVVNLFNAVAKDGITLTFNATVKAMIDTQMDAEEGAIYDAYMNSNYDFDYA